MRFEKIGDAAKEIGLSIQTLRRWIDKGKIPHRLSPGGHRLVDVDAYFEGKHQSIRETTKTRESVFYCRVSSSKQSDDLERQISLARENFPDHIIVKDIGSGLNWKRKGLQSILERVMRGEIEEIVVFHRDRLCRFGFELVEFIISSNKARLVVYNDKEFRSSEQELAEDIMAVVHVFSCRQMGRRRYAKRVKSVIKDEDLSDEGSSEDSSNLDE
jgi:predicted site-specific integrase-resolvase